MVVAGVIDAIDAIDAIDTIDAIDAGEDQSRASNYIIEMWDNKFY